MKVLTTGGQHSVWIASSPNIIQFPVISRTELIGAIKDSR